MSIWYSSALFLYILQDFQQLHFYWTSLLTCTALFDFRQPASVATCTWSMPTPASLPMCSPCLKQLVPLWSSLVSKQPVFNIQTRVQKYWDKLLGVRWASRALQWAVRLVTRRTLVQFRFNSPPLFKSCGLWTLSWDCLLQWMKHWNGSHCCLC